MGFIQVIGYRKLPKRGNSWYITHRLLSLCLTSQENPVLNLNNEILLPIVGYENIYQVSNLGYITNGRKQLKTFINNNGYRCLKLQGLTGTSHVLLHRVVAQHFIPNWLNKPEVNHNDGNKDNCAASNLSWMTSAENKKHAKDSGLWVYNKPSTGIKIGKSSRFNNVLWDESRKKWVGTVRHNSKNHFQKRFNTEEEAALHVNWIIDQLGLTDRVKNII